jgi:hypothetical protein
MQRIGLIGSLIGITSVLGLIVFLGPVHAGRRSEIRLLLRVAGAAPKVQRGHSAAGG